MYRMRQPILSDAAPQPIGPYSQAIRAGDFLFISGIVPVDPGTNEIVPGDIAAQTDRVLLSIGAILEAAGASYAHVVRTTVFLADLNDFSAMNEAYGRYFPSPAPARATVQVARLPRDARLEIDAIAFLTAPVTEF
jgi:2-iminobutanoate/2-iminopropanoate deaminase